MLIQLILVLFDVAGVLAVEITDLADGRNAEAHQITMAMGGVALEVALQAAIFLRHGQFIVRQGEVVHAYVAVSRVGEQMNAPLQHGQLFGGGRQVVGVDTALRRVLLRQMSIVEQREPVRLQVNDRLNGSGEACWRLQRQAVYQIDAQRVVLQRAGRLDDGACLLQGLHAIDGALNVRVQILHADADAVET